MAELPPTPTLGLVLPDPGTNEQHSTAKMNSWFQDIDTAFDEDRDRIVPLETTGRPTGATPGIIPAGTAAQRDAFWGAPGSTPGDAAARVALANKGARWFNTEKGYEQQYFAQFDDAGVTATTPVKTVHGWGAAAHLGVVPMRGSGIVVPAGTANRMPAGVKFTNATRVALDGVFSADFEKYLVEWQITARSVGAQQDSMVLRAAGVDNAAAYSWRRVTSAGSGVGEFAGGGQANWNSFATSAYQFATKRLDMFSPGQASRTMVMGQMYETDGVSTALAFYSGHHEVATAFDGLALIPSAGTFSGTLRVYGYND